MVGFDESLCKFIQIQAYGIVLAGSTYPLRLKGIGEYWRDWRIFVTILLFVRGALILCPTLLPLGQGWWKHH